MVAKRISLRQARFNSIIHDLLTFATEDRDRLIVFLLDNHILPASKIAEILLMKSVRRVYVIYDKASKRLMEEK